MAPALGFEKVLLAAVGLTTAACAKVDCDSVELGSAAFHECGFWVCLDVADSFPWHTDTLPGFPSDSESDGNGLDSTDSGVLRHDTGGEPSDSEHSDATDVETEATDTDAPESASGLETDSDGGPHSDSDTDTDHSAAARRMLDRMLDRDDLPADLRARLTTRRLRLC